MTSSPLISGKLLPSSNSKSVWAKPHEVRMCVPLQSEFRSCHCEFDDCFKSIFGRLHFRMCIFLTLSLSSSILISCATKYVPSPSTQSLAT
jgi:hypothetical protein